MKILSAEQMKRVDRLSTTRCKIPSLLLMENAGFHLYLALRDYFEDLQSRRIAIFCGKGNNGGDGMVLARQLLQRGLSPDLFLLAKGEEVRGDARANLEILHNWGQPIQEITSETAWKRVAVRLDRYDILVDALLGTGIRKPLQGLYAQVVADLNRSDAFVLSVDIPSGMFSDSVQGGTLTVKADLTVTFTAPKIAHILNEDQEALGDLYIVPIGTPAWLVEEAQGELYLMTRSQLQSALPPRPASSHKGNYGHVLVLAGSLGKAGAAALTASAALQAGSGLVTAAVPDAVQASVASFRPEIMTEGLPSTPGGRIAHRALDRALQLLQGKDAVAVGPGLGTDPETVRFIHELVRESPVPLVIDADALNAFEGKRKQLINRAQNPLVLTPHPGEFSRLSGTPVAEVLRDRIELARRFARRHQVWLVLKTFRTLVAAPDGKLYACPLGNPGMATAGMGDVLTGILAALLGMCAAQGRLEPDQITQAINLGVYLHATAGDAAAEDSGPEALTARDVIAHLGEAYEWLGHEQ